MPLRQIPIVHGHPTILIYCADWPGLGARWVYEFNEAHPSDNEIYRWADKLKVGQSIPMGPWRMEISDVSTGVDTLLEPPRFAKRITVRRVASWIEQN